MRVSSNVRERERASENVREREGERESVCVCERGRVCGRDGRVSERGRVCGRVTGRVESIKQRPSK